MAAGGDYTRKRVIYQNVSTNLLFTATTDDTTLITGKTNHTIYVQRIIVWITTSTAATETFQDHTTAKQIAVVPANPGANTRWDFDFGPNGVPLTTGENLLWNVSAVGHAGHLVVEAYMRPDAVQTVSNAN